MMLRILCLTVFALTAYGQTPYSVTKTTALSGAAEVLIIGTAPYPCQGVGCEQILLISSGNAVGSSRRQC